MKLTELPEDMSGSHWKSSIIWHSPEGAMTHRLERHLGLVGHIGCAAFIHHLPGMAELQAEVDGHDHGQQQQYG